MAPKRGEGELPENCRFWDGWPGPSGFYAYFGKFAPGLRATHCDKWNAPFMHGSVESRAKLTNTDLEFVVAVAPR